MSAALATSLWSTQERAVDPHCAGCRTLPAATSESRLLLLLLLLLLII